MTAGMITRQRDIVLVPFPYSDFSIYKKRPVLVLSSDEHNSSEEDIICCAITTNPRAYKGSIPIYNDNLEVGNLRQRSRIKPNKLFTLHQNNIIKKIARLNLKTTLHVTQEVLAIIKPQK